MGSINTCRVVMGGLLAGVIIFVSTAIRIPFVLRRGALSGQRRTACCYREGLQD